MVSKFYQKHSANLLIACIAALPVLTWYGEQLPSNNDIETWLPRNTQIRTDYDEFVRTFGADEVILVAFQKPFPNAERLNSLSMRLHGLKGVASCWTRQQVIEMMLANDVDAHTADERLVHLLSAPAGDLETLMVVLNDTALHSRQQLLDNIRSQIAYCDLNEAIVAGAPVVASQLDMLGSRENSQALFGLTLFICGVLLYLNIGCWKTSLGLMALNVLSIQATLSVMHLADQQMNFILSSLPVMVMVFTTAASIHFIGQYTCHAVHADGLSRAMKAVLRPSLFAALTTMIGLLSLAWSDVGPIPAFGRGAAVGTVVSFLVGIGLTPCVLTVLKYRPPVAGSGKSRLERFGMLLLNHPLRFLAPLLMITVACSFGLRNLRSLIDPLEFLPGNDPVLQDTLQVKQSLTSPTSIEAVIDFGGTDSSFVSRLKAVQKIEDSLMAHPNVCHTLSLADFFPARLDETELSVNKLMSSSGSSASSGLIADGSRLWRISIRLHEDSPKELRATLQSLMARQIDHKITFTGLGPLLEKAQGDIFEGFWKSFTSAFLLISVVMILALRSLTAGIIAMVPNLTPILLVFGLLGWCDYPIDIGIMMTASIALGLAVDGTFHFLFSYQDCLRATKCRYRAVRRALMHTGMPIICSAIISGTGLLALGLSPFRPTMRFGVLMFCLLLTALIGDLILLPAFLALGTRRKRLIASRHTIPISQKKLAA